MPAAGLDRLGGSVRWLASLGILAFALLACGGPTPSTQAATVNPTETSSAATLTPAPIETATAAPETKGPSLAPPTAEPPVPTVEPGESIAPSVDSFKVRRTADCQTDNGTGTVGSIRLTWSASGTSGVRISIDPPSADVAYDYGFADYAAAGSAVVPFACNPPNHDATGDYHLYVVTTLHEKGAYYWRYAKVYAAEPAST
jgi:hypothetical protein